MNLGRKLDVSPWHLGGLSVAELVRRVRKRLWKHEMYDRAAGLSYYFLFALFPTLLFLTTLLGLLPIPRLMDRAPDYVTRMLPGDAASLLTKTLTEVVRDARGSLASISVLVALWGAASGMVSIRTALNVAHDTRDVSPWWRRRLDAVALTVWFSVFTLLAAILTVFGERIGEAVAGELGVGPAFTRIWNVARWPAQTLFALFGITLVYHWAPAGRQRWRWVTPGSITALAAWLLASFGLRLYVRYFGNYNATYGSIGGVILLMLWFYLSGLALLVGAEIDCAIDEAQAARRRDPGRR